MGAGRGGRRASERASGIRRGEDALSQAGLFESESSRGDPAPTGPLAARVRPRNLADFVGQGHLLGPDRPLRRMIESGRAYSMVFWGPPGTGKTTLARLIAAHCEAQFLALSAVMAGVKDIRNAVDDARRHRARAGADTILFVDEAHRFNKAQQDAFLPFVEDGTLVFIGATTENPSFELNNALLSRARVYVLTALAPAEIRVIIDRALRADDAGRGIEVPETIRDQVAAAADGDARRALNTLELVLELAGAEGRAEADEELLGRVLSGGGARRFDKGGDAFYDQISALHKSIRGSDPDASLYWLARMLDGGCDPLYVARRLVRAASEDIGNADPRALAIRGRCVGRADPPRQPGRRARHRPGRRLPRLRAQEQRRLQGLRRRDAGRFRARLAGGAPAPAQRPHRADEEAGLRAALPLCPRRAGRLCRRRAILP